LNDTEIAPGFAPAYTRLRGDLYRALVLITGNRDLATEAVDRGFSRWHRQLRRDVSRPEARVIRHALKWARRRSGGRRAEIQGFRLPGAEVTTGGHEALAQFDHLDIDDRALLTLRHYLRWDDALAASALGYDPEDIPARSAAAEARVNTGGGSLADILDSRAKAFPEPMSRLESSRRRGATQRIATVVGLGVLAVATVGGGALGVAALIGDDPVTAAPEPGSQSTTARPGVIEIEPQDVEWIQVPLGIREGDVSSITYGPEGFAALATDFARTQNQNLVFVSEDGLDWIAGVALPQDGEGWIGNLAAVGDRYLAVGSRWDSMNGDDIAIVCVSTDGLEWSTSELPVEKVFESDGILIDLRTSARSVTGDASTITVYGTQYGDFDLAAILRDVLPADVSFGNGWGIDGDVIEIYDPNGEMSYRATAEELGIDPELVALLYAGQPVVWTSTDGVSWSAEYLGTPSGEGHGDLARVGDVTVALTYGSVGNRLLVTRDGENWEPAALPQGAQPYGVRVANGTFIAYGSSSGSGPIWTSHDGTDWAPVGESALEGLSINDITASSDGVAAIAFEDFSTDIGPAVLSVGDYEVTVHSDGRFVLTDDEGATIAEGYEDEFLSTDDETIAISDPESDEPLVTISQEELAQAWEEQYMLAETARFEGSGTPRSTLLVSPDLEHWTTIPVSETIGEGFYPNTAAYGGGIVVMTGYQDSGIFDEGGSSPTVWITDLTGE